MSLLPVFPIRLLMLILPVAVAGAILAFAGSRGVSVFKKQGVAWAITAAMIVIAIVIGLVKYPGRGPTPDGAPPSIPPASETVPPDYSSADTYIQDDANVLSASTETVLANRNAGLINRYGVAIGVVTCNYGRDDLYDYTIQRAEDMGLSDYDFVVVLDIRGGVYGMIQGMALVNDFTDDDCARYARDYMERYFAAGDYDSAVRDITEMLELWYGIYFG